MKDTNDVLKITKLAEAGDVAAMIDLARRYEGGLGVDKDVDTAFWWWKKADSIYTVRSFRLVHRRSSLRARLPEIGFLLQTRGNARA